MQNWQKNRNYRKYENTDGSFKYVITVDGEDIEVSAEIYTAYAKHGYKMENMEFGFKRDRVVKDANGKAVRDEYGNAVIRAEREISLEKLIDEEWDLPSPEPSAEEIFLASEEIDEMELLYRCMDLLADDECALVKSMFFDGMTEREYSKVLGVSKTALHARKVKVLNKLKILMEQ